RKPMPRPRTPAKALTRLLAGAREPLAVVDANRTVVFCNAACAEWLGAEAAEILGRVCHYHAGNPTDPLDMALATLCPPREALAGRRLRGRLSSPRGNAPAPMDAV